jgi:hypothetical protein
LSLKKKKEQIRLNIKKMNALEFKEKESEELDKFINNI